MRRGSTTVLALSLGFAGLASMTSPACGGRTACFEYSQAEYQASANSCPNPMDALANFTDPTCPGPVVSVDGPGSFDGQLCCYAVTQDAIVADCGSGSGGANPSSGTGGDQACTQTCSSALQAGTESCQIQTGAPAEALAALEDCVSAMCARGCLSEIVSGTFGVDESCNVCAEEDCATELKTCGAS